MKFPWADVMALGLGQLRLAPDAFWSMTLRELMAAAGTHTIEQGLPRTLLTQLMERYPDGEADRTGL
jgi:uncharacterized phage protein (TIGR02216 family)